MSTTHNHEPRRELDQQQIPASETDQKEVDIIRDRRRAWGGAREVNALVERDGPPLRANRKQEVRLNRIFVYLVLLSLRQRILRLSALLICQI